MALPPSHFVCLFGRLVYFLFLFFFFCYFIGSFFISAHASFCWPSRWLPGSSEGLSLQEEIKRIEGRRIEGEQKLSVSQLLNCRVVDL